MLANQLAESIEGAERGHEVGEKEGAWPSTNQNGSRGRAPLSPPLDGVAVETKGSDGYCKAGAGARS